MAVREYEQIIERAIRDWCAPRSVDADGIRYAVLHDLATHGYQVVKFTKSEQKPFVFDETE